MPQTSEDMAGREIVIKNSSDTPPSLKSGVHFHGVVWKGWPSKAGCWVVSFSANGSSEVSILLVEESPGCLISTEAAQPALALKCENQIKVGNDKRWKPHSLLGACRDTPSTMH